MRARRYTDIHGNILRGNVQNCIDECAYPCLNLHLHTLEVSQRSSMGTAARVGVPRRAVRDLLAFMNDAAGGEWAWWSGSLHQ